MKYNLCIANELLFTEDCCLAQARWQSLIESCLRGWLNFIHSQQGNYYARTKTQSIRD